MWSPTTGWASSKIVLEHHNLKPIELKPKEGIALINGTQLITSLGAEAVILSQRIAKQADIVAAVTLEVYTMYIIHCCNTFRIVVANKATIYDINFMYLFIYIFVCYLHRY